MTMQGRNAARGFTLIELMIAVAIIGILASIALPLYNGYVGDSERTVLVSNIRTINLFQEDYRLRQGTFGAGVYDADGGDFSIRDLIGWDPQDTTAVYTVTLLNDGAGYRVVAESVGGTAVCRDFPGDSDVTPCPP